MPRQPPSPAAEPAVQPPLPAPLAAHLRSRFAREGERKLVTVLFADIRGSTELVRELDPEQALHRLEPGLHAMAESVHRFGGTVNRVLGDGIMALFGAPLAYEDHAVRACLAAQAMIEAVGRLRDERVEIRVGLNSGEVVVRSIDHDLSMEYDAVGATTHLANRMEQLAVPGTACLTPRTARLVRGFIEVRPRGLAEVKGVIEPVELFEMVGAVERSRWQVRASAHNLTQFVGRETEMRILSDALTRAKAGRGQVVAIAGEAGMGKSRLVHEFLQDPLRQGVAVLSGAATPHDLKAPYELVMKMLRSWIGVDDRDSPARIAEKLEAALHSLTDSAEIDVLPFRSLLDLPVGDAAWAQLDPAQRRQQTYDALRQLIVRIAGSGPCVVVFEDVHWADAESQAATEFIVDGLGRTGALTIVTHRPEFDRSWGRHGHSSLIQLKPLEAKASDALLRSLLGDAPNLQSLRSRVIEQTDGSPLFLEEMARTLVDTGVLTTEPNRFRLTRSVAEVEIPESVQAVLATRIDRLPADERTLLQIASVIGKDVPRTPLQVVAAIPVDELERELSELCAQEFLYEATDASGTGYSFKHALTHSVVYESMLLRHRRELHASVLAAIEQQFPDRMEEFTERLAEHALRGEVWDKVVTYSLRAGQRANARSAHGAAAVFFQHALNGLGRLPPGPEVVQRGIDARLGLRVALAATADLEQVAKYLSEAEALAVSVGDERRLMPIVIGRSTILTNLGALDDAVRLGVQGRGLAERFDDDACFVSSGFALGQAFWNRGEFGKAEEVLSRALDRMQEPQGGHHFGTTGSAPLLCLVSLSHTHCLAGRSEQAFARSRKALELAAEAGRPYDLSYAHAALGLAHLTAGELESAIDHLEEAWRVAQEHEIALLAPHAARYLGRANALVGRLGPARMLLSAALDQARSKSLRALQGWCGASLGLVCTLSGDGECGETLLETALAFARTHGYRPLEAHALRLLGFNAAGPASSSEAAEGRLREAAVLADELGMRPELACCRQNLGDLLVGMGRDVEGREELAAAEALFAACGIGAAGAARLRLPFRRVQEAAGPQPLAQPEIG